MCSRNCLILHVLPPLSVEQISTWSTTIGNLANAMICVVLAETLLFTIRLFVIFIHAVQTRVYNCIV